jgi:hypothetical protein
MKRWLPFKEDTKLECSELEGSYTSCRNLAQAIENTQSINLGLCRKFDVYMAHDVASLLCNRLTLLWHLYDGPHCSGTFLFCCDCATFLWWFSPCTVATFRSLLCCGSGHILLLVVERVCIWEGKNWLLGASKQAYVSSMLTTTHGHHISVPHKILFIVPLMPNLLFRWLNCPFLILCITWISGIILSEVV